MRWLDPFATFLARTIDAVFGVIFLVLAIPVYFEFEIEELVNVFERDVLVCTAFWWHMLRVIYGHFEDALEAVVTHSMGAGQFG